MTFISNIQSVAKYESKLLIRSWFFRVFTVLAVAIITFFNFMLFVSEDSGGIWIATAIPSNIPYLILLLLNTGQAVIAIFLASDFLKRDKKLDTSEVFYVRPLSNAEYVIGKIWGNLRVFLLLNLIIMAITAAFNLTLGEVDWVAYLLYFFLTQALVRILLTPANGKWRIIEVSNDRAQASSKALIFSAAAIAGRNVRILHQLTQPADHPVSIYHPEGEYLKGLVLYVE